MRTGSRGRCSPMSSASLTHDGVGIAGLRRDRAPVWISGLVATVVWLAAASVIFALPDIDDFERTNLLGRITAGVGLLLLILAVGGWLSPRVLPGRTRSAGP